MMLSEPVNVPTLGGVQVTLNVQAPAAASAPAQVSVTLKAAAFKPVMVRLKVAPSVPVFCTFTVTAADVAGAAGGVESTTAPRFRDVPEAGVGTRLAEFCTERVAAAKPACGPISEVMLPTGKLML